MLWLGSHDQYGVVGEFDPSEGLLGERPEDWVDSLSSREVDGCYSEMEEGALALYKWGDIICLYVFGRIFELNNRTVVEVSGPKGDESLCIMRNGRKLLATKYHPLVDLSIPLDPTPMAEPEHFDFGLLVSNVSKDPERKALCLERWGAKKKKYA